MQHRFFKACTKVIFNYGIQTTNGFVKKTNRSPQLEAFSPANRVFNPMTNSTVLSGEPEKPKELVKSLEINEHGNLAKIKKQLKIKRNAVASNDERRELDRL